MRSFMRTKCVTAAYVVTRVKHLYGRTRCSLSITVGGSFGCGTCLYPHYNPCYRAPVDVRSPETVQRVSNFKAEQSHVYRRAPGSNGSIVLLPSCCCTFPPCSLPLPYSSRYSIWPANVLPAHQDHEEVSHRRTPPDWTLLPAP